MGNIVGTFGGWTITTDEAASHFGDVELDKLFKIAKNYGGGLVEIEARNPEGIDAGGLVVATGDETITIREGRYLTIYNQGDDLSACVLISRDDDVITSGNAYVVPVNIDNGSGKAINGYAIGYGENDLVTAELVMAGQLITGAAHEAYKEKESAPKLPETVTPEYEIVPMSKLAQTASAKSTRKVADVQRALFETGLNLDIGGEKGNGVTEAVVFEFDGKELAEGITYDDIVLQEAIASIYHAGGREFTIMSVWRAMTGVTDPKRHPGKVEARRIEKLIKKHMGLRLRVDLSKVAAKWKRPLIVDGEELSSPVMEPRMIEAVPFHGVNSKGEWVTWWQLTLPPAFYIESFVLGQVSSYPLGLLESESRDSSERVAMRHYIMRRLKDMQNQHAKLKKKETLKQPLRRIRYAAIADAVGIDIGDTQRKKRLCDYCLEFCKGLADKGEIKGVAEYYKKRTAGSGRAGREGIEIML